MSTHTTVTTWANGFGRWHARVAATDTILNNHFSDVARAAIAGEIRLRDSHADLSSERFAVKLYQRPTSHNGTYEAEYVESWADPCVDCEADGYDTLTRDTNADGEPLCEGCATRRAEDSE